MEIYDNVKWSFEAAKKMAYSFQTPLHISFQKTIEYADKLRAEIHILRGRLSYYEALNNDPDYESNNN